MGWVVKSSPAAMQRIITVREEVEASEQKFELDKYLHTDKGRRHFNYCYLELKK